MNERHFDLLVIGSGPAGQASAMTAAKLGKRVAVIDRITRGGDGALNGGTIPSKTLREAVLFLSGLRRYPTLDAQRLAQDGFHAPTVLERIRDVQQRGADLIRARLRRENVTLVDGLARFEDPHTLVVGTPDGAARLRGDHILIGCGSRPSRPPEIPFDGRSVIDASELRLTQGVPRELIVVGGGVIGLEYASMLAALDAKVTVIDMQSTLLEFVDREIVERLFTHLRNSGAVLRLGERVVKVERQAGRVSAHLASGRKVRGDTLLYAVGRQGNADRLNVQAAGLVCDPRGRLNVDDCYRTEVQHIYAAGDVIGFPALASTSMLQGRHAARAMFGVPSRTDRHRVPHGIYTVPEISMVGPTEEELTRGGIPYEVGTARFEDLARGQIAGDSTGYLKLLFDPEGHGLLAVHALGAGATELVHVGQAVLELGGRIEYFRETVFNHPTFSEAYAVASQNGLDKLRRVPLAE